MITIEKNQTTDLEREGLTSRCAGVSGESTLVTTKPPLDEKYWLERAKEAYTQADRMTLPEAKRMMLEIAAGYQRLAQLTEERTGRHKQSSS
jgi:hypothetical protein